MAGNLYKKVCAVTGSGRGIGRAIALLMASEGAMVVVNDLGGTVDGVGSDRAPANEVADEITRNGGTAVANYDTVTTTLGGENIVSAAIREFGRIDVLVNNAGVFRPRQILDMTEEDWDVTMSVHLKGHFCCTKPAAKAMLKQGFGSIINISSIGALGMAGASNYSAAKAAILGFTRALAKELGPNGIRVNAVMPRGGSRMTQVATSMLPPTANRIASVTRDPGDAAAIVAYLASDAADGINGFTFHTRETGIIDVYGDPTVVKSLHRRGGWTIADLSAIIPSMNEKGSPAIRIGSG